jgi:hypothetical protein
MSVYGSAPITVRISADHLGRIFALVGELDPDRSGAGDHMRVGQDVAIVADDETRADARAGRFADIGPSTEAAEEFVQRMIGRQH